VNFVTQAFHESGKLARTKELSFGLASLSIWFSADGMLIEKRHEPELLVDLLAPKIVDWQSCLVLRPPRSERARGFVRYVFH
jgi:hypothetical protein